MQARLLAEAQIPLLRGTETALRATAAFLHREIPKRASPPAPPPELDRWRQRLSQGILNDVEALDLLADFGIPTEKMYRVPNKTRAAALAREIGYPVALKAVGLIHKSEHNGLRLNLRNAESLASAWRDLESLELPLAIQHMAPPGLEVAVGMVNDPQVGPVMIVGAGGVLVELLGDSAVEVPPLDRSQAGAILQRLRLSDLLAGYRGSGPLAEDHLVDALVAFSGLVHYLGDLLQSIDVNPIIVHRSGVAAVDALVF
jgi:acyl-CoA synthetase (NDP forming)